MAVVVWREFNLRREKLAWWILKRSRRTEYSEKANPRPYVNTKLFSQVLKDEAQHFGVGKNKRIILPLDQAGWHTRYAVRAARGNPPGLESRHIPQRCNQLNVYGH